MVFMAMVMVECASGLSEPSDMALEMKRFIRLAGASTFSSAISGPAGRISSSSRSSVGDSFVATAVV